MPARNMTLSFGLFSVPSKVAKAINDDEAGFSDLCVGQPGKERHAPSPKRQPYTCEVCGPITDTRVLVKGQKQGKDTYAIVSKEEIEAAKETYGGTYLDKLDLVPVPSEDFLAGTIVGDSLNFVTPANVGDHDRYQLLVQLINEHPELSFVGLHTPRSATHLYRITVLSGCLVMEERLKSDRMRAIPEVGGEVNPEHYLVAEASLEIFTQAWDPAAYEDEYKEKLRQMVTVADVISTAGAAPTSQSDNQVIELLTKRLEKLAADKAKPAKKTAAARRTAAKTTTRKKVTA